MPCCLGFLNHTPHVAISGGGTRAPFREMEVFLGSKELPEQMLRDAIKAVGARFTNSMLLTYTCSICHRARLV